MHLETIAHPVILLHGGAGTIRCTEQAAIRNREREAILAAILRQAYGRYQQGASALDLVEFCVREMEDSPLFNAGIGSVLTEQGWVEMDASIMDGTTAAAGAVALIRRIRHPISAARFVMEKTPYVFLAGPDAEQWLLSQGLESIDPEQLKTPERIQQWEKTHTRQLDHSAESDPKTQTVGAVALDQDGRLAAATSTGGMMRKAAGRIGDSAVIGAGTFADNRTCAVSTTGEGEFFLRTVTAAHVHWHYTLKNTSLQEAVAAALHQLRHLGGHGGIIALDHHIGAMGFTTSGMYRAVLTTTGDIWTGSLTSLQHQTIPPEGRGISSPLQHTAGSQIPRTPRRPFPRRGEASPRPDLTSPCGCPTYPWATGSVAPTIATSRIFGNGPRFSWCSTQKAFPQ